MWTYFVKDLRILLRDRKELAILLLMPFILIVIFSFALGGFLNNDKQANLLFNYILVVEDDEAAGRKQFVQELSESQWPDEAKKQLLAAAEDLMPLHMLRQVLESDQLTELASFTEMELSEARLALQREEAAAIVRVPANYTYQTLRKMLLDSGDGTFIEVESSKAHPLGASIMVDILNQYTRTVSLHTAIGQTLSRASEEATFEVSTPVVSGGLETVTQYRPITPIQYYTFGMVAMYVLFVASTVSSRAYLEKKFAVYDRILVAGSRPLYFLASKAVSAAMIAFLQMLLLFGLSHLFFRSFTQISPEAWLGYMLIGIVLAVCIGAITMLLTALNFRSDGIRTSDLYNVVVVVTLALLGGSFMPTFLFADWVHDIAVWTPNGAALRSFMLATQGADLTYYGDTLLRLLATSLCASLFGLWLFPRRGEG